MRFLKILFRTGTLDGGSALTVEGDLLVRLYWECDLVECSNHVAFGVKVYSLQNETNHDMRKL